MEVVERGTAPKERTFRGTCHACKSTMEAKAAELKVEHGCQRDPGDFAHAACPVCGADFVLYPKPVVKMP